jgi:hypothetical protein
MSAGGGLVNLDTWVRACETLDGQVMLLLGEATFHQVHGGIATNAPPRTHWNQFHEEYMRIRGKPFARPRAMPLMVGRMPVQALPSLRASLPAAAGGGTPT